MIIIMAKIEVAQLLHAGAHFGHKSHRWNPGVCFDTYTDLQRLCSTYTHTLDGGRTDTEG